MFLARLNNYNPNAKKALQQICEITPATDADYQKFYGNWTLEETRKRHGKFFPQFELFRLKPKSSKHRNKAEEWVRWGCPPGQLDVDRCRYCRTLDDEIHHADCPHGTPDGSEERRLNEQGEQDGRQKKPAQSEHPAYMLGYNWGVEAQIFLERNCFG